MLQQWLKLSDKRGHIPLCFCECQWTSRQRHTSDGVLSYSRSFIGVLNDVEPFQDFVYQRFIAGSNITDDHVLVSCKKKIRFSRLCHFKQGCLQRYFFIIEHTTILDEKRIIPQAFVIL